MLDPQQKMLPSLSIRPRREYTCVLISKKSLLICFENYQSIPYSHKQSIKRMVNTLIMVNITSRSYARGNKKPGLYLQEADNILALNTQIFYQKKEKEHLTGKRNFYIRFFSDSFKNGCFTGLVVYKSSVLVLVSLTYYLSLRSQPLKLKLAIASSCNIALNR